MVLFRAMTIVLAVVIAVAAGPANAGTILVVGQAGDKIGDAIAAANNGDVIIVTPWTYTGVGNVNLSFAGKAIEVRSQSGPETTIIDCESVGQTGAFLFINNEVRSSILSGFTIRNGNAQSFPTVDGGGADRGLSNHRRLYI